MTTRDYVAEVQGLLGEYVDHVAYLRPDERVKVEARILAIVGELEARSSDAAKDVRLQLSFDDLRALCECALAWSIEVEHLCAARSVLATIDVFKPKEDTANG